MPTGSSPPRIGSSTSTGIRATGAIPSSTRSIRSTLTRRCVRISPRDYGGSPCDRPPASTPAGPTSRSATARVRFIKETIDTWPIDFKHGRRPARDRLRARLRRISLGHGQAQGTIRPCRPGTPARWSAAISIEPAQVRQGPIEGPGRRTSFGLGASRILDSPCGDRKPIGVTPIPPPLPLLALPDLPSRNQIHDLRRVPQHSNGFVPARAVRHPVGWVYKVSPATHQPAELCDRWVAPTLRRMGRCHSNGPRREFWEICEICVSLSGNRRIRGAHPPASTKPPIRAGRLHP